VGKGEEEEERALGCVTDVRPPVASHGAGSKAKTQVATKTNNNPASRCEAGAGGGGADAGQRATLDQGAEAPSPSGSYPGRPVRRVGADGCKMRSWPVIQAAAALRGNRQPNNKADPPPSGIRPRPDASRKSPTTPGNSGSARGMGGETAYVHGIHAGVRE